MARSRRRSIIWSSEARADLSDIWNYYARTAGRQTANKIAHEIGLACGLLQGYPFAGRARDEVRPGFRSVAVAPHVVFYRVRNGIAEIVRVLDGRRDLDKIFTDEPSEN